MLRAVATWVVVSAVAAVGVAAAVDALRPKHADRTVRPTSTRTPAPPLGTQLREAGIGGVLLYADGRCRLHALRLPGLDPTELPETPARPARAPGSEPTETGCTIPPPTALSQPPRSSSTAQVLQLVPCRREIRCSRVLLSRADLARAAPHPFVTEEPPYVARELAWISGDRLARFRPTPKGVCV